MNCSIATPEQIAKLSKLSVRVGNIPFLPDHAIAAILEHPDKEGKGEIVGFAAVQEGWLAAGSWVKEDFRRQGHTYEMRQCLENEMRRRGIRLYLALPGNDFEKHLFSKYGLVTDHAAQMRHL